MSESVIRLLTTNTYKRPKAKKVILYVYPAIKRAESIVRFLTTNNYKNEKGLAFAVVVNAKMLRGYIALLPRIAGIAFLRYCCPCIIYRKSEGLCPSRGYNLLAAAQSFLEVFRARDSNDKRIRFDRCIPNNNQSSKQENSRI